MVTPQEGDAARSPRDVENSAPTSLLKVLLEMRKEKLIVPSRQIMRIVQEEEGLVRMRATTEDDGHSFVTSSSALSPVKAPLLTQLVEQILEYCRRKLLDEEDGHDAEDQAGGQADAGEEEREQRLAVVLQPVLRRCTETYGQFLLINSEFKPSGRHKRAVEANSEDMRKKTDDSGKEGERSAKTHAERQEGTPPRSRADRKPNLSPGTSGRRNDASSNHPTPFYETVYALVARAVQQGMRIAAEGSKLSQENGAFAHLAARVEKELACLFRSPQFSRNSGRGLLKGGAKVDVSGGSEGIESAQLAARAEANLNSMIKKAEKLTSVCTDLVLHDKDGRIVEFKQTEKADKLFQQHAQAEAKQIVDQAEKSATGALDSKEVLTGSGDHGTSESVDAFIAGFWARAIPKQKDQAISLQTVASSRSPMISSVLPSPRGQALGMKQKQLRWNLRRKNGARVISQQAQLSGSGMIDIRGPPSSLPPLNFLGEPNATIPFKNAWAFSQERVFHSEIKQPPSVPSVLTNRVAPLIV